MSEVNQINVLVHSNRTLTESAARELLDTLGVALATPSTQAAGPMSCLAPATHQFLWVDPSTGLNRVSRPLCEQHCAELQPADTVAVLETFGEHDCEHEAAGR